MEKRDIPERLIREIQAQAIDDYLVFTYGTPTGLTPGSGAEGARPRIPVPHSVLVDIAITVPAVLEKMVAHQADLDYVAQRDRRRRAGHQDDLESF